MSNNLPENVLEHDESVASSLHEAKRETGSVRDTNNPYTCEVCGRVVVNKKGLLSHLASHKSKDGMKKRRGVASAQQKARKVKGEKKRAMKTSLMDDPGPSTSNDSELLQVVQEEARADPLYTSSQCASQATQSDDRFRSQTPVLLMDQNIAEMQEIFETVVIESIQCADESLEEEFKLQAASEESVVEVMEEEPKQLYTIVEMEEDPYILMDKGETPQTKVIHDEPLGETLYYYLLLALPNEWTLSWSPEGCVRMAYLNAYENVSVTRTISWNNGVTKIFIHNIPLPEECFLWTATMLMDSENIGEVADNLIRLSTLLHHSPICPGVSMYNGLWKEAEYQGKGSIETIYYDQACFRSKKCQLITIEDKTCYSCRKLKTNFKNQIWRKTQAKDQKFVNNTYMNKDALEAKAVELQETNRNQVKQIGRLREKIKKLIASKSMSVSQEFSDDLATIFQQNHSTMSKALKLFWSEQMKALAKKKNPRTVRWNPFVIKMALHLQMISRSAYEYVKFFIELPSQRTLYDFSHVAKAQEGAQEFIMKDLSHQIKSQPDRPDHECFFNLLFDEIHIKSDIVVRKSTGEIVGYTNLSSVEQELQQLEAEVSNTDFQQKPATKALVYMAQGITTGILGVVGVYATDSFSAGQLFSRTWNIIYRLESCGLKVIALVCDGASMNKKFFKMHTSFSAEDSTTTDVCYFTKNVASCDGERPLFFVIDPPHLLKTLRNCLANSYCHKKSRTMWKDGEKLSWQTIELLYEVTKKDKYRSNKLTRAHVNLTSYGCMKVVYAAQVMSKSVANNLKRLKSDRRFKNHDINQLCQFIEHVNDFFDCLNSYDDPLGKRVKENDLLKPYSDINDPRLYYLTGDFLNFFNTWDHNIATNQRRLNKIARERMYISHQSYESLKVTVHGFVGAVRFMLKKGSPSVSGRSFNQDKLEQYFGIIRQSGGGSDNPTLERLTVKVPVRHIASKAAKAKRSENTEVLEEDSADERPIEKRRRKSIQSKK